jgi:hypothetical protein
VFVHGAGVAVFKCSAPSCRYLYSRRCIACDLYIHGNTHTDEFLDIGLYACEFVYHIGFVDEHDRINHYREGVCIVRPSKLPEPSDELSIDGFQAPPDNDPSDILRYLYLGGHVPAEKHFKRKCKTNGDPIRLWEMYSRGVDMLTHYNAGIV